MNAKELRIGNYVKSSIDDPNGFDLVSLVSIFEDYSKIQPIPLTEEWLLKFGFVRYPWGLVIGDLLFKDDMKCTLLTLQVMNGFTVKITHVHQLQNLYFALTGKELTI